MVQRAQARPEERPSRSRRCKRATSSWRPTPRPARPAPRPSPPPSPPPTTRTSPTSPSATTPGQQWVDAGELTAGEQLRRPDGTTLTIQSVRNYPYAVTTHNLTVSLLHTYYVLAGATPVLVHNCGGEPSDELLNLADAHIGKTNVAAEVVATDGTRGFGVSVARSLDELTPKVRAAVQATGHHGGCAEIGGLCELESRGAPIEGARGQAVHVMGGSQGHPADLHGEDLPFCASCRNLFRYLEGGPLHE
ncbi:polymorphic toxin-type HINT domain-containing protein [Kitasatospora sp. NPDC018614]|uniref:polymorphic toxin-type HINT domain-containing protein n=1 Tax=unclassified Kitasatospora TaxID=2633591 RepID=UPI0037BAF900